MLALWRDCDIPSTDIAVAGVLSRQSRVLIIPILSTRRTYLFDQV